MHGPIHVQLYEAQPAEGSRLPNAMKCCNCNCAKKLNRIRTDDYYLYRGAPPVYCTYTCTYYSSILSNSYSGPLAGICRRRSSSKRYSSTRVLVAAWRTEPALYIQKLFSLIFTHHDVCTGEKDKEVHSTPSLKDGGPASQPVSGATAAASAACQGSRSGCLCGRRRGAGDGAGPGRRGVARELGQRECARRGPFRPTSSNQLAGKLLRLPEVRPRRHAMHAGAVTRWYKLLVL